MTRTVSGDLAGAAGDPRYVAALAVADPVLQGTAAMELLDRFPVADIADGDALRLLGMAAHAIGDTVRSVDYLSQAEAVLREQGRLGLLSQVLSMQVIDWLELGDWNRAAAAAGEGERLAYETGQPIWRAGTLVCDRGAALVTTGQYAAAYPQLRRLFDPADPSFHQRERFGAVMFLADAALEVGERADAREVVTGLEAVAAVTPSPMLRVHLRYARRARRSAGRAGRLCRAHGG